MNFLAVLLFTTMANAQTKELDKAKADISELLRNRIFFYDTEEFPSYKARFVPKDILVMDDRIEFKIKKTTRTVYFADKLTYLNNPWHVGLHYMILGNTTFMETTAGNVRKLADNIIFIQNQLFKSQLALFEPIAVKYLALKVKPPVSEAQREYIVQANSFNEQRNFSKAIEHYNKAIEIDQTAYPAAYSNLALLSAQTNNFNAAIYYMKKYLLLEPEASDARSAQDKIYEWKARTTN